MVDVSGGMDAREAAEKWIATNPDKVTEWTNGAQAGNGESINLVYVAWDTENTPVPMKLERFLSKMAMM